MVESKLQYDFFFIVENHNIIRNIFDNVVCDLYSAPSAHNKNYLLHNLTQTYVEGIGLK